VKPATPPASKPITVTQETCDYQPTDAERERGMSELWRTWAFMLGGTGGNKTAPPHSCSRAGLSVKRIHGEYTTTAPATQRA
jgi:hypothetical protein